MSSVMKKSDLIAELAESADLPKAKVSKILNDLAGIAYREARNGFTVPGICKLKVIKKKASRYRNPATGKLMMLGERDVVKTTPLKKAKDIIAPRPDNIATEIKEEAPAPKKQEIEEKPASPQTEESIQGIMGDGDVGNIVFECAECGSVLSAPLEQAGMVTSCPICEAQTFVPSNESEKSAEEISSMQTSAGTDSSSGSQITEDFITFVCQACGQEIEAPIDMVSMDAVCPTCGSSIHVPEENEVPAVQETSEIQDDTPKPDKSAMTIRIDLSDLD